jgi:hypothetical protein
MDEEIGEARSTYGEEKKCTQGFGAKTLSHNSEDVRVDGWIILKGMFKKWEWEARTGLILLRTGTGGGLL